MKKKYEHFHIEYTIKVKVKMEIISNFTSFQKKIQFRSISLWWWHIVLIRNERWKAERWKKSKQKRFSVLEGQARVRLSHFSPDLNKPIFILRSNSHLNADYGSLLHRCSYAIARCHNLKYNDFSTRYILSRVFSNFLPQLYLLTCQDTLCWFSQKIFESSFGF